MRVIAVSAEWCKKCRRAKEKLKDYEIEWIDIDYHPDARSIVEEYDIYNIPAFIIMWDDGRITVEESIFRARDILEENKSK